MAKTITIGVSFMKHGNVTISVPDTVTNHEEAVKYVEEHWDDIPLPTTSIYINDSASFDEEEIQLNDKEE